MLQFKKPCEVHAFLKKKTPSEFDPGIQILYHNVLQSISKNFP